VWRTLALAQGQDGAILAIVRIEVGDVFLTRFQEIYSNYLQGSSSVLITINS
jgi:hypothetical protein